MTDSHIERTVALCCTLLAHNALMPGMSSIVKKESVIKKEITIKNIGVEKSKKKEKEKDEIADDDENKNENRRCHKIKKIIYSKNIEEISNILYIHILFISHIKC